MKIHGKRYGAAVFILLLGAAAISFCFLMIGNNKRQKAELERESRGFYSEAAQKFMVFDTISEERFMKALSASVENGIVYLACLNPGDTVKGVWYQGEIEEPELAEGRFFQKEDFSSDAKKAVAGRGCLDRARTEGGVCLLDVDGEEYEVIGVLDAEEDTRMGQTVFVNLNAAFETYGVAGDYVLDGMDEQSVRSQMASLSQNMYSDEFYYGSGSGRPDDTGLVRVFGLEALDAIYAVLIFNFVVCGIFITAYWLHRKRLVAEVYALLGLGRGALVRDVGASYVLTALCGAACGFVCFLLFDGLTRG